LYVEDHCQAIDFVFHDGKMGETYNIGGDNEVSNLELVHRICKILTQISAQYEEKKLKALIQFVPDRKGHDYRYAIDSRKIQKELGWRPLHNFEDALKKTIQFYIKKYNS